MIAKIPLPPTQGSSIRTNIHKPMEIPHLEFPTPTNNLPQQFKNSIMMSIPISEETNAF